MREFDPARMTQDALLLFADSHPGHQPGSVMSSVVNAIMVAVAAESARQAIDWDTSLDKIPTHMLERFMLWAAEEMQRREAVERVL